MEQVEMKFPGLPSNPFRSYSFPPAQKRNWRRIFCTFLLVLCILIFFILTIIFFNKSSSSTNNHNENDSTPILQLHKQIKKLSEKIDLLTVKSGNEATAPFSFDSTSGNGTESDEDQTSKKDFDSDSESEHENPLAASILHVISSSKPDSRNKLVNVIGRAKAHIVVEFPEHEDKYMDFHYNQNGSLNPPCQNLPLALQAKSTFDAFGTCIRFYSLYDCVGGSMAYYPKINDDSEFFLMRSLGRCFANELDESAFKIKEKSLLFQKSVWAQDDNSSIPAVPDFLQVDSFMSLDSTSHFNSASLPITDAILDQENRITLVRAVIQHKDLKNNVRKFLASSIQQSSYRKSFDAKIKELSESKREGDVRGFIISRRFSPQERRLGKIVFYQSPWNFRHLTEVENTIYNWLRKNPASKVEIRVQVYYEEEEEETRPDGFLYWVKYQYREKNTTGAIYSNITVQMYYLSNLDFF